MAIVAKQSGEARKPVPAGNYFGVCIGVYDIGTQPGYDFGPKHQVVLQWELWKKKGCARDEGGKPLIISQFHNLAFSDKSNLRKDCERILGRTFTDKEAQAGYDVTQLLEKSCRMTIAHEVKDDGSVRDSISAIMPLDEDDPKITPVSDSIVYELDASQEIPESVPLWIKKKVEASAEWTAKHGAPASSNGKTPAKVGNGKSKAVVAEELEDIPF